MPFKIVETDNFGRDYPNESFVNIPAMPEEACKQIAEILNRWAPNSQRYYKVEPEDYKLVPGFEP